MPLAIRHLWWCVLEARPVVQLMFVLRFVTAGIVSGPTRPVSSFLAAGVVWWLAVLAVYLFNGVTDATEDSANGSCRPIASGRLSRRVAGAWSGVSGLGALAGATAVDARLVVPVVILLGLGYLYSAPPVAAKRSPAPTIAVVLGAGTVTYLAGGYASSGHLPTAPGLYVLGAAMSLWMALVCAVVKDISDTAGDALARRRTLALRLGPRRVRCVACGTALAIGVAFVGASVRWAAPMLPAAVVTLLGGLGLVLVTPSSYGGRDRRRRPYHVVMATQFGAHLAALATILLT